MARLFHLLLLGACACAGRWNGVLRVWDSQQQILLATIPTMKVEDAFFTVE